MNPYDCEFCLMTLHACFDFPVVWLYCCTKLHRVMTWEEIYEMLPDLIAREPELAAAYAARESSESEMAESYTIRVFTD